MANKLYKSKVWLRKRWVMDRKTVEEIAAECGCTTETIHTYLNIHGLKETRKK